MQEHHTTSGSHQPGVDVYDEVERVLKEVGEQKFTFNGCLHVTLIELPFAPGVLHPLCARVNANGEHSISSSWVLRDEDTTGVYCTPRCAAAESVDRAITIAKNEGIYPIGVKRA